MKNKKSLPSNIRFAALAVDVVCFRVNNGNLEMLVGEVVSVDNLFKGYMAHIGGLIQIDETAEEAIDRLMKDKAGLNKIYKEQLYTFSKVDRDPRGRVVAVAYIGLLNESDVQDLEKAKVKTNWRSVDSKEKLAYDHNEITKVALDRLRSKVIYTDIAKHLISDEFTLSDLQKVYEAILGEGMDKRNFRKRILSLGVLHDTKRTVKKGVMRPATLYTFKTKK